MGDGVAVMTAVFSLNDVTLGYDRHPAVHHLTGKFSAGSLTAVVGPNGSGKSTLLKIPDSQTLYGMASAPRRFYFFLRGIMLECGFRVSKFDECVFLLYSGTKVCGIAGVLLYLT